MRDCGTFYEKVPDLRDKVCFGSIHIMIEGFGCKFGNNELLDKMFPSYYYTDKMLRKQEQDGITLDHVLEFLRHCYSFEDIDKIISGCKSKIDNEAQNRRWERDEFNDYLKSKGSKQMDEEDGYSFTEFNITKK